MKLITVVAILLIVLVVVVSFVAISSRSVSLPYTVSESTTRLVGPLLEDGSVDFVSALIEPLREGVTPENNAAVLLWQASGSPAWNRNASQDRIAEQFFAALQLPPLPAEGDYFLPLQDYSKQLDGQRPLPSNEDGAARSDLSVSAAQPGDGAPPDIAPDPRLSTKKDPRLKWGGLISAWPARGRKESGWAGVLQAQFRQATLRPWSRDEFPELAAWLAANQAPLQRAYEASHRARFYSPLISADEPANLATIQQVELQLQELCLTLAARAMLSLGAGQTDDAWQDILALHRLARRVSEGPWVVNFEAGSTLERTACACGAVLSFFGDLSGEQLRSARSDLRNLAPLPEAANQLDKLRYPLLEQACAAARGDSQARQHLLGEALSAKLETANRFNWDEVLTNINGFYDLLVEAGQHPDILQRESNLQEMKHFLQQAQASVEGDVSSLQVWTTAVTKATSSNGGSLLKFEIETKLMLRMADIALSLAAHHAEQGSYPTQLSDLVPTQFAEIPIDPYTGQPLVYRSDGNLYCVYSIGGDGFDEGGSFHRDVVVWSPYPNAEPISLLIWRLRSLAREVSYPAAAALVQAGEAAVPALKSLLQDDDNAAREGAAFVLNAIQQNQATSGGPQ